jgi:hypothetical protein
LVEDLQNTRPGHRQYQFWEFSSGNDHGLLLSLRAYYSRYPPKDLTSSFRNGPKNMGMAQQDTANHRAETGSSVYSLILGTRTYVVLSSDTAVNDLLDKRSNIYSSRPDMYMGQGVASGGLRMVVMKIMLLYISLQFENVSSLSTSINF